MRRRSRFTLALVLAATLGCTASEEAPSGEGPAADEAPDAPLVSLRQASLDAERVVLEVVYARPAEAPGPRMAELWLELEGLGFEAAAAGDVAVAAGKQLIAQDHGADGLRLVLMATGNAARVEPGVLARVTCVRAGGEGRAQLRAGSPVFAPGDANAGLQLGEPLKVAAP